MRRHTLDIHPVPADKEVLYINEPWLIDDSLVGTVPECTEPEAEEDNIRVYIPLGLNKNAILRRVDMIINRYGEANEGNEFDFQSDIESVLSQVEIYDQIWFVRHLEVNHKRKHSVEAADVIGEIIARLEEIPDGCAEVFPFELIERLQAEYLV